MEAPEIAIAGSVRDWPDRLHRHLLAHGGGTVVGRALAVEQVLATTFDVLVIDDVCSFLTPKLVTLIKRAGADVLGVFSPSDGPDAKQRLLECGIADVIESDASADEFARKLRATFSSRLPETVPDEMPRKGWSIGVTGAAEGVGATEIAIGLGNALATSTQAGLVDIDPVRPSIAQRLDLPLHPNLRTALDLVMNNSADISSAFHIRDRLTVVGGVADRGHASPISYAETALLLDELSMMLSVVVADLGPFDRAIRGVLGSFHTIALVGASDPVGIARALQTAEKLIEVIDESRLLLIPNQVPRRRFHQTEIRAELRSAFPNLPIVMVRSDPRVTEASWEGALARRGPFSRAMRQMASLIPSKEQR